MKVTFESPKSQKRFVISAVRLIAILALLCNQSQKGWAVDDENSKAFWQAKTASYWKEKLTPEQYEVCREKGTERPFSGQYAHTKEKGVYKCVCCGLELFDSTTKFDSGTGWPSYWEVHKKENIDLKTDRKFFMLRTEVLCSRCGAHLGHVFDDGPKPTGKRYCINSVCLKFEPASAAKPK